MTGAITATSVTGVRETNEDRHVVHPYLNELSGQEVAVVLFFVIN